MLTAFLLGIFEVTSFIVLRPSSQLRQEHPEDEYPHGAGITGAPECGDDADLHACDAETGLGREIAVGWVRSPIEAVLRNGGATDGFLSVGFRGIRGEMDRGLKRLGGVGDTRPTFSDDSSFPHSF